MSQADERILEVLDDRGNLQPASIAKTINEDASDLDYNPDYIQQRCAKLHEAGLLDKFGRGVYSISDTGRKFLQEDLDVGELK